MNFEFEEIKIAIGEENAFFPQNLFIGLEFDHWLPLSLTPSLTH